MKQKTIVITLVAVAGVFLLFFMLKTQKNSGKGTEQNDTPSFSVSDETGKPFPSEKMKGKFTVIHFWATWCPPCVAEIPSISAFYKKNFSNDKLQFVFIPYHDALPDAKNFLARQGISLPLFTDPNDNAANAFGVTGVPETYVVDPTGKIIQRIIGGVEWDSKDVTDFFTHLLN